MKKENTPLLETPRLILRKFTRDDLQDLFLIYSDETVNTFLPWFPFQTMLEAEAFFCGELESEYKKEVAYRYAIVYKPEKRAVGYVSLCGIDEARACGDLGYGLRKEYWNRGIVTEAAGAVLARLKENGFRYITATHDIHNPASGEVMKKIGMKYCYSYAEQWQPKDFRVIFNLYRIDFVK